MRRQCWALGLAAVITAGIVIGEAGEFIAKLLFVPFLANIGCDMHATGMQKCKPASDLKEDPNVTFCKSISSFDPIQW